jgi:DNA (cytosine-5)-methyltransferase 1
MTYRILDLFCGAGGAAKGYADAGFEVVGVDIKPQPNYPFEFFQADALETLVNYMSRRSGRDFDAIHASPPCQRYSRGTPADKRDGHPDLIAPVRELLQQTGLPYIIENVEGSPLVDPVLLCGSAFELYGTDLDGEPVWLKRHRLFEIAGFDVPEPGCSHPKGMRTAGAHGGGGTVGRSYDRRGRPRGYVPMDSVLRDLFRIDWMTGREIRQAIPPIFTDYAGTHLRQHLNATSNQEAA